MTERLTIKGRRTNAYTGVEAEWVGEVEIEQVNGLAWLHLIGGPTGYESMPVADLPRAIEGGGWAACFGTPYIPGGKAWDKLTIEPKALQEVLTELTRRAEEADAFGRVARDRR